MIRLPRFLSFGTGAERRPLLRRWRLWAGLFAFWVLAFGSIKLASQTGETESGSIAVAEAVEAASGAAGEAGSDSGFQPLAADGDGHADAAKEQGGGHGGDHGGGYDDGFPTPLSEYQANEPAGTGLWEKLVNRASAQPFNLVATALFLLAILHTFASGFFRKLAHKYEHEHEEQIRANGLTGSQKPYENAEDHVSLKATVFHFLGEVEAVFGLWVLPLMVSIIFFHDWSTAKYYLAGDVNYTEPMFVVIIMAIAATRPVLRFAEQIMAQVARLGGSTPAAWWFSLLTVGPVLGSFITEPAAMTIVALLLARKIYDLKPTPTFAYATLGLLFVNISVGGTLTHFAAPPVLMVAARWEWGIGFMMSHFGWKAAMGIIISNLVYFVAFRKEFAKLTPLEKDFDSPSTSWKDRETPIPGWITLVHLLFLGWTVFNAHYPVLFIGGFLFFLAFVEATYHHQNPVNLRSPLLVGFFLAGLVTHGNMQQWWIEPVLSSLSPVPLMLGAVVLTAFNDNAAITYLATLVPSFDAAMKYAVVAGAVTGGGLTVIANAPNPAGQSILQRYFKGGVSPLWLAVSALVPTIILGLCYMLLPPTS